MIGREKQLIKKLNKQNSNYTMDYMLSLINEEEVLKQKSGIIWSFYKKQRKDSYGIIKKHFLLLIIMLLIIFITSAYETFLVPKVFNLII